MSQTLSMVLTVLSFVHLYVTSGQMPEDNIDEVCLLQTGLQNRNHQRVAASWPLPDEPGYQITPAHRALVKTCKAAVKAHNVLIFNTTCPGLALAPTDLYVDEGVHAALFQVLHEYQDDQYQWVQQWAWRGLSDQSSTERGSDAIANFGGPNKGIEYMVHQLLAHPEPYYGYCKDQLTVQYEILACMGGLIQLDNNNTRGPAAMEAGLVPAIIHTLESEPNLRASQGTACRVMTFLFWRNPDYAVLFKNAGALPLVNNALERFTNEEDKEFLFGATYNQMWPMDVCEYAKAMMEGDNETASKIKSDMVPAWTKPWLTLDV